MKVDISFEGIEQLQIALIRKAAKEFHHIGGDTLTEMFNRAKGPPYTPVDTRELLMSRAINKPSMSSNFSGEFGYAKDYAPFVEYGHRTRDGGYVAGQYYLRSNVEAQRPIYKARLIEEMRKD